MKPKSEMTQEELTAELLELAEELGERGAEACTSALQAIEDSDDAAVGEFSAAMWEITSDVTE